VEGLSEGDVVWAELGAPRGAAAAYRRPLVVVQADWVTKSGIGTVICVPLSTNLRLAEAPGNVLLAAGETGLKKDSVAVVSGVIAVDRTVLDEPVGRVPRPDLRRIVGGIDLLLAD
jgi:mRNA interferase MazF